MESGDICEQWWLHRTPTTPDEASHMNGLHRAIGYQIPVN
jgi:hypothetical protein